MPHRILILSQGHMLRWNTAPNKPYLNISKHLLIVDGETLLGRTRRLFAEAGCEVVVVGPQKNGYKPCVTLKNPHITGTNQDKFLGCRELWSKENRTIITWGDCFLTEEAVKTIITHPSDDLHYFRRTGPSRLSGHKWDESFAISFGPDEQKRVLDIAFSVVNAIRKKKFTKKDHIRTHYAASLGLKDWGNNDLLLHASHQTNIDDWTDDFDRPDECTRWLGRYYNHKINAAVCIPWRANGKEREYSRRFVHQRYSSMARIHYGTANGKLFNRAAARNAAAKSALEMSPSLEVLFFVDSDTFVSEEQFWASCYLARTYNRAVLAYYKYCHLSQNMSTTAMNKGLKMVGRTVENHMSGALAVPVSLWRKIGGYDERFVSWGGEDRAFMIICDVLSGVRHSSRVAGIAYHLWHPVTAENDSRLQTYKNNVKLGIRYKQSAGRSEKLGILPDSKRLPFGDKNAYALLSESGGPLNPLFKSCGLPISNP